MAHDGSQQPPRRRLWPEAEKVRMVRAVEEGGLSVAQVAECNGVHRSVLDRWRRERKQTALPGAMLVPVQVTAPEPSPTPEHKPVVRPSPAPTQVDVALSNGRRLTVSDAILPARLRALVTVLEQA